MPESNVDVMTQGKEYKPEGEGYSNAETEVDTTVDVQAKAEELGITPNPDAVEDNGENKKLLILVGIIVGVVLVVIIAVVCTMSYKKKKEEEERLKAEALLAEEQEEEFKYTDAEIQSLRDAGYTGDEIELFEFDRKSAQELIEKAKAERQEMYEREILPYFDAASDEFKELYEDTWVGQGELEFDSDVDQYTYHQTTLNVDYEKIDPTGRQLFLKLHLKSGICCFMTVTPERYLELDDSGNIVVSIYYTKTGDGAMIITDITEIIP